MFDISAMLGNSGNGSNNAASSFNFTDYAAIKNGSYGKLVKSYYGGTAKSIDEQKLSAAKASSKTKAKKTEDDTDKAGVTALKKNADELRTSAQSLAKDDLWKKTEGKEDTAKIADTVKDFAANYNKVLDKASKVSSREVSRDVQFMTQMTGTFSKVLGKIGVNVEADGKLSVNEDALKKADMNTARTLFTGNGSYGSQIADKAAGIYRDADMGSSIYGSDATTTSAISSVYNQFI
ncbi:MAG: hypothetical protein IKO16_05440 [Lachnospiraceae bacterium]|nr:hypothetical protein [Lachnospiraceae bacterium]